LKYYQVFTLKKEAIKGDRDDKEILYLHALGHQMYIGGLFNLIFDCGSISRDRLKAGSKDMVD